MRIKTRRFGALETVDIPTSEVFEFEPGLSGFEGHRRYARLIDKDSPVEWLQSTDDPDLVFALLDPFLFCPDYSFEMSDADAAALGLTKPSEALVRTILMLRDSASAITANLMAPIVLNPHGQLGRQIVLQDSDWAIRFPVLEGLQAVVPTVGADNQDDEASDRHTNAA